MLTIRGRLFSQLSNRLPSPQLIKQFQIQIRMDILLLIIASQLFLLAISFEEILNKQDKITLRNLLKYYLLIYQRLFRWIAIIGIVTLISCSTSPLVVKESELKEDNLTLYGIILTLVCLAILIIGIKCIINYNKYIRDDVD